MMCLNYLDTAVIPRKPVYVMGVLEGGERDEQDRNKSQKLFTFDEKILVLWIHEAQ